MSRDDQDFRSVIEQRNRIREQIRQVRKQFEFEKQRNINDMRTSVSRSRRNRVAMRVHSMDQRSQYSSPSVRSPERDSTIFNIN